MDAQESDFSPGAIQWSDSTDRLFSTRSNDPSGRGVDRGGLTTICTFLSGELPLGFNEDPASPISEKNTHAAVLRPSITTDIEPREPEFLGGCRGTQSPRDMQVVTAPLVGC